MNEAQERVSEFAIASLVIGVLAFIQVANMEKAFAAIVFGIIALRRIKREEGTRGKGLAVAGIVLGFVACAVIVYLTIKFWPQIQQMRQPAQGR